MTIRSDQFDDVYFSIHDGLAEARHVFLAGNQLPDAWHGKDDFVILETGFGTGLNFLAVWESFELTAKSKQHLHYISFEKHPLSIAEIKQALLNWPELSQKLDVLLQHYPLRIGGWHRLDLTPQIHLTLIFDDVNNAIPELDACVDAIFLDGFSPAKNPDMWSDTVFENLKRLCHSKTTVATFSAARLVREGLHLAGFNVEKAKGFGHKRDMITGHSTSQVLAKHYNRSQKSIAIIGAGLSGAALAYVLHKQGHKVRVLEAAHTLATGASGNPLGLYNPRFTANRGPEAEFYMSAFANAYRTFSLFDDVDFHPVGALHLATTEDKRKRFFSMMQSWGWHTDHMDYCSVREASRHAGFPISHEALWLPQSGFVSPEKLVRRYLRDIEVEFNATCPNPYDLTKTYDVVIIAHGQVIEGLPISTVRGQISYATSGIQVPLQTNICYGGYCTPVFEGRHIVGSTFQPWLTDTALRLEDGMQNLDRFEEAVPELKGCLRITGGRAALRLAAQDRFPVIGFLQDRVYTSTAQGSHGLLSSLMGAQIISDQLCGIGWGVPRKTAQILEPSRFVQRKSRKINSN